MQKSIKKISILCPSYNHERYVGFFIESVLSQSFEDFELVIVDDCSSDNNVSEIKKYQDERIKLIQHPFNMGINAALNTAFEHSSGEIIIFCASDDIFKDNALERIHAVFKENDVDVVYPSLSAIDSNNVATPQRDIIQQNRSNIEILKYIFLCRNCLTSPAMSVKREKYNKIHPLPNSLSILQDVHMHVALLINSAKLLFLQEKLLSYRIADGSMSVSKIACLRERHETMFLMDTFLKITDVELLKEIFKNEILKTKIEPYNDTIPFFLGRMALEFSNKEGRHWGSYQIMQFYKTPQNAKILHEKYNFTFKDYLGLVKFYDKDKMELKYKKYKKLFNTTIYICAALVVALVVVIFI